MEAAIIILRGAVGMNGVVLAELPGFFGTMEALWISALLVLVWLFPNSQQLMGNKISFIYPGEGPRRKDLSLITESLVKDRQRHGHLAAAEIRICVADEVVGGSSSSAHLNVDGLPEAAFLPPPETVVTLSEAMLPVPPDTVVSSPEAML